MIITNLTDTDYWFGPMRLAANGTLDLDDTLDTSLYLLNDEVADAVNTLYLSSNITVTGYATPFPRPTGTPSLLHGDGSPEGLVYAPQGSLYMRRDSTHPSTGLYTKTTGVTVNTGWFPVIAPAMEMLQEITVASGGTATINFDPIPQSFSHLKIIANLEKNGSADDANLLLTVNGTGAGPNQYCSQLTVSNGSDVTGYPSSLVGAAYVGLVPATPYAGATEITLAGYTNGNTIGFTAISGCNGPYVLSSAYSGGIVLINEMGGVVNSIQLALDDESDFLEGSVATLYGLSGNVPY